MANDYLEKVASQFKRSAAKVTTEVLKGSPAETISEYVENNKVSLIIMATLPLGFIGVIWALFLTGTSISIVSLMAIFMLIGIVVNNAILILDYSNNLVRNQGAGIRTAAIEGAKNKFRAILMTNLATILAMTPLALGLGAGGEVRQPMAVASIGGLMVSTILTLFFIPLLYWMFARFGLSARVKYKGDEARCRSSGIR